MLQRTTRKFALTEAGQAFYERGVKILQDIRDADAMAKEFQTTSKGILRINTSPTLYRDVSNIVARYAKDYPETTFDLTITNQMGDLLDDKTDLAIRDDSVTESSLIVRRLGYAEWTVCASPSHVERHGFPLHPTELSRHNCLVYVRGRHFDAWRFAHKGGIQSVNVCGCLLSNDPHVLRTAALLGQGLILLPNAMLSEYLQAGRLVRVMNDYSPERAVIRAVYLSRQQLPLKVRNFLDFAAKEIAASQQRERLKCLINSDATAA